MARPAPCRACCRRRHSLVGLWIIWIGRVRQRDDRKQDRHDARDRTIRGALAISVMSVVGAKAENICSQRVFRLLTHLRLRPDATDMVARPLGPAEIEALSLSQLRQSNIGVRASARCSPQSTIIADESATTFVRLRPLVPTARYALVARRTSLRPPR